MVYLWFLVYLKILPVRKLSCFLFLLFVGVSFLYFPFVFFWFFTGDEKLLNVFWISKISIGTSLNFVCLAVLQIRLFRFYFLCMQLWFWAWNLCVIQMRMQISDGEQKFWEKTSKGSFICEVLNLESNVDIWNANSVNYVIFRWEKLIRKYIWGGW